MHRESSGKSHGVPPRAHERPSRADARTEEVWVRLTRKYAEMIDGVNLEHATVGDRIELSKREAEMLIAEGWAERSDQRPVRLLRRRATAADSSRRSRNKPKP